MRASKPLFLNRELSWLEFNQRVLDEAKDPGVPLLERLNFLSITASNLDEFFMIRVGGLELLEEAAVRRRDPSGLTPAEQLEAIHRRARRMVEDQNATYLRELEPALAREGITRMGADRLTEPQARYLEDLFQREIFPVATPMDAEAGDGFPLLRNLGVNLLARLKPKAPGSVPRFAVIPIGANMDRMVTVPAESGYAYIMTEEIIRLFADRFFPGESVAECVPFRITRNADLSAREDTAADFLAEMEEVLDRRKESGCVRLEIEETASRTLLRFLRERLRVRERHVYEAAGPLALSAFRRLASVGGFESLRYKPWPPQPSPLIDLRKSVFDELSSRPVLLYHPYDGFEPVVRMVEEAADDPDVLAIKQILYRTSPESRVIAALKRAAERGKSVTVIVELKARFDEARNIEWARELERAGAQIIYGVKGLKTHAKVCIVVRREPHGVARYLHFGTGNYNETTARLYCDASYMTRDEDLGSDASAFFNAISGHSEPGSFLKLEAAPIRLREKLLGLIENETARSRSGQKALILAKMNSLADGKIIRALYRASQAGVKVRLNVRGICCLRAGVRGLSENISVVSIVDRFLEHARIFYFHQGGEGRMYISSADWMPRNLDRRIELLVPVDDEASRRRLMSILEISLRDNVKGRRLAPDGRYGVPDRCKQRAVRSQQVLYQQACAAVRQAQRARRTVFEPHRPSGPPEKPSH